jgi:2-polyprenyl-6-methoxyphenol hydroxylase-like FAD-dependent oxidoreductase
MKIIIVGAGVAGLCTYLYLRKNLPSNIDITIYESHHSRADTDMSNDEITFESLSNSTQLVGGALGVGPNGMRILNDLDPTIHDEVVHQGFVVHNALFRSARGWTLSTIGWGDQRQPEEFCVSIARHRLWAILKSKIGEGVIKYRRVKKVNAKEGGGAVVCFEEGVNDEVADLVIGADGVKSTVRRAIFGDEYGPVYEYVVSAFFTGYVALTTICRGLLGVGGFIEGQLPPLVQKDKAMVFTFGPNGFFGYSASADKETMWWSTCEAEMPEKTRVDPEDMRAQLQSRHCTWKDPVIQDILEKANVDSIYPTWTTPLLPHWGTNGLVLVGDAAHGLQPTSGQGSSQAFEGAKTLSLLLKHYLAKAEAGGKGEMTVHEACDKASRAYYKIRGPRITKIVEGTKKIAQHKKDMGLIQEMIVYFFMWLIGTLPVSVCKSLSSSSWEEQLLIIYYSQEDDGLG